MCLLIGMLDRRFPYLNSPGITGLEDFQLQGSLAWINHNMSERVGTDAFRH